MKNKEKYAKEIIDVSKSGKGLLAINKNTGRPCGCFEVGCIGCAFNITGESCEELRKEWEESEYKEPLSVKAAIKKFDDFCDGKSCEECKYSDLTYCECMAAFIFDNYNVTEKGAENDKTYKNLR